MITVTTPSNPLFAVQEANLAIPDPSVVSEETLIFTQEYALQIRVIHCACSRWHSCTKAVAGVLCAIVLSESLSEGVEALLLTDCIPVRLLVNHDPVFADHTSQDSGNLARQAHR